MKKLLLIVALIILAGAGYYALSPLFNEIEVDDALPKAVIQDEGIKEDAVEESLMPSGIEKLTPEELEEHEKLMEEARKEVPEAMEDIMPTVVQMEETETPELMRVASPVMGTLGHPAEGSVRVLETAEGTIIRYEDFSTINGPQLHVYLARDLGAEEFIDLGPIRGTKGNINYSVPENIDLSEYRYVMYWCVPFSVLFNYAEIN